MNYVNTYCVSKGSWTKVGIYWSTYPPHFVHAVFEQTHVLVKISNETFKDKSPEVPFHGITSPYSYIEVIWIFALIQQEAKHDQEKISAEQK